MSGVEDRPRSASDLASSNLALNSIPRQNRYSTGGVLAQLHDAEFTLHPDATQSSKEDIKEDPQPSNNSTRHDKSFIDTFKSDSNTTDEEHPPNMLEANSAAAIVERRTHFGSRVANSRTIILTARMNLRKERQRVALFEKLINQVIQSIIAHLDAAPTAESFASWKDDLLRLAKNLKETHTNLEEQRTKTTELEDNLSSQEYILTELESEMYQVVDRAFRDDNLSQQRLTDPDQSDPKSIVADSRSTIGKPKSPVEELYSRMGDLRIYLDRLNDFDSELRDEMDERDALRAAGKTDLCTEDEFFAQRRLERAELQLELEKAQEDVRNLKDLCRSQGLKFEDVQSPTHFDEGYTESLFTASAVPSSKFLENYDNRRERVHVWLSDPPEAVEPQPPSKDPIPDISEANQEPHVDADSQSDFPESEWENVQRPSSTPSMPAWKFGPPPGSELLRALLLESTSEALTKHVRSQASHTSL